MATIARAAAAVLLTASLASNVAPALAAGAFAVGACGAYGYAYDFVSMSEARKAALVNCSGKGCRVVGTMRKRCAAMAIELARRCGASGWSIARHLGEAENNALRACYKSGGKDCVIRAFACDGKG